MPLLLSIFLLCFGFGGAQSAKPDSGSISGTALDPSGAVIAGANVRLNAADGSLLAQASTDGVGNFRFDHLGGGAYVIVVAAAGFRDVSVAVKVGKAAVNPLRIAMKIAVQDESVTVASGDAVPQINTEISENKSANSMERDALDRVPVFDQDYVTTLSRFLSDDAMGTNGMALVVNGVEANGPGVSPSAGFATE